MEEISAHVHSEDTVSAEALWPPWHYDVGRSIYWYLCTHHLSYFIHPYSSASEIYPPPGNLVLPLAGFGEMDEYEGSSPCFCEQNSRMADMTLSSCPVKSPCCYEGDATAADVRISASSCPVDENGPSLPSGWVEDFLIDCYLGGSFGVSKKEPKDRLCMESGTEMPTDTQTLSCDDNVSCSKAQQQENEDDCLRKSEKEKGIIEGTDEVQLLEAWQAQYGQVVRSDAEAQICHQAINLWNWTTVVLKAKGKSKSSICLRGRIGQTSSRLRPMSQPHNGFMKTTCICAVNLDLVKVLSGEVYRLRQPSSKYLSSVAVYDSSNPTKDWNFPHLSFTDLEDTEGHSDCAPKAASKLSLVAKPFVPNLGHQRYQHLNKTKTASPSIPVGLRALSKNEIASVEERKQKYRDRAKERRALHGVDTEHAMHHSNLELCSSAKDMNNGQEKEPKRHATAQRMLEKMGWCEGEGLGKRKDGLKEPLNGMSNHARAGIGWSPHAFSHSTGNR